jgi:hypothetical protein
MELNFLEAKGEKQISTPYAHSVILLESAFTVTFDFGCHAPIPDAESLLLKLLASFNNHEEACNMLCGKGQVRTQDLGYQSGAI